MNPFSILMFCFSGSGALFFLCRPVVHNEGLQTDSSRLCIEDGRKEDLFKTGEMIANKASRRGVILQRDGFS